MSDTLRARVDQVVREMENELLRLNERARAVDYALLQIRPLLREEEEDARPGVQEAPSQTRIEVGGYVWLWDPDNDDVEETWYAYNAAKNLDMYVWLRKGMTRWRGELVGKTINYRNVKLNVTTMKDAMQVLIDFMNNAPTKDVDNGGEDRRPEVQETPSQTKNEVGGYEWVWSPERFDDASTWYAYNAERNLDMYVWLRTGMTQWRSALVGPNMRYYNGKSNASTRKEAMQELIDYMNNLPAKEV